jgi:serine phosphatase RsbU (regulator of sigma subunit)
MSSLSTALLIIAVLFFILSIFLCILYYRFPMHKIIKSKSGFQDMLDGISDPLVAITPSYVISRANRAYVNFTKSSFDKIIGKKCYNVLRNRTLPCDDCTLNDTMQNKKVTCIEHTDHPSGKGTLSITLSPYSSSDNCDELNIIEHIRDISLLETLKHDLEKKNYSLTNIMTHLKDARLKIKDELKLAKRIQLGTLPESSPLFNGLKITSAYHPIADVGGDFYDFIEFSPTKLGVFIGDASGHGLAAAFVATISKMSLFHNCKSIQDIDTMLTAINNDMINIVHTGHYLTCFWGIIDTERNTITFSRAGHPHPVIIKRDASICKLESSGPFIGIMETAKFEVKTVTLEKGDRLFLFTDGIYDVFDRNDSSQSRFGYDRFIQILSETSYLPFGKIITTIQHMLTDYTYSDDYTLIAIEFTNNSNNHLSENTGN